MSDAPSWASGFDSCTLQCLTDAVVDAGGCSDLSDTDCFCKEDALLAMTLSDSLYLCLGLTCDPYLAGTALQDMIAFCAGSGAGIDDIDSFSGSGTPGSTTPANDRGSTTKDAPDSSNSGGGSNTNGGLSAAAKGGIAGGVVSAVVLLLITVVIVLRRYYTAKNGAPVAGNASIVGAGTTENKDSPHLANPEVHPRDFENQAAAWTELSGKEIPAGPDSSGRGTGSVVELGPNPLRAVGTLPGKQSLGYSSVVTELETYPPVTMELDGVRASSPNLQSAGGAHARGRGGVPESEGLIPVTNTTCLAEAISSSMGASGVVSQVHELSVQRVTEDLDRLLRLDEELEERRRTLEEIKEVQTRQAVIRKQIKDMQAQ